MRLVKQWIRRALHRLGYTLVSNAEYENWSAQRRANASLQNKLGELLCEFEGMETPIGPEVRGLLSELSSIRATDPDYQLLMAQQTLMASLADFDPQFRPLADFVSPYTMTSLERLHDLYKCVEYLVKAKVPGDILECGVWRGGSMMLVAKTLVALGDTSRMLYLFDTFEGHPKPDAKQDVDLWGNRAVDLWVQHRKTAETSTWAYVSIDEVRRNMELTGYPMDKVMLVKGMVEKTAAANAPQTLALVRLDTDWYASSKTSLETFWPKLSRCGVLIIDDYGHYRGQREAVDEYFANNPVLLHRVDYAGRTIVKTH